MVRRDLIDMKNCDNVLDEFVEVKFAIKDFFALKCFLGDLIRIIVMNGPSPINNNTKKMLDDVMHLYSVLDESYKKEEHKCADADVLGV